MLDDVFHGRDQRTRWLRPEVKKGMFTHWETDAGFRHQRLTNQANRAPERSSKYTCGSATVMKTKARMSKSLDREATLAETFKYTYMLKENKARFLDQWSQDHCESNTQRLEAATQQSQQRWEDATDGSATSVVNPDAVWRETASVAYKNRVYQNLCTSTLRPPSGSATNRAVQPKEGVNLRLQVQELQ
ncbi:hypothetical protein Ahy_B03g066383 [Arachis hypogaea]|uniref:Uncharacterized protein n=1 Tax=Arachis hypogaea TaxID=3818 RepID=A0A445A3U5_ARAHY|nr:hypothetical protein Ahy_B03g066383 [Arachis hypogaea]